MADEGTVNSQITDSVAQVATAVLGPAPTQTTGMLDAVMAEAIGMAMYNAVTTQHNSQMVASAAIAAACARMLKIPGAAPLPFKLVLPVVTGTTPARLQVTSAAQEVQVAGSNFQQDLSVDVFGPDGSKIGSLSGSQQISGVASLSFTMNSNLFVAAGNYGIEVVNPDGGRSSRYEIAVESQNPSITAVANTSPSTGTYDLTVTGSGFQPKLTVNVTDHSGAALSGIAAPTVASASSFTVVITPGSSTGPFSIQVVNPDGGQSNAYLFTT